MGGGSTGSQISPLWLQLSHARRRQGQFRSIATSESKPIDAEAWIDPEVVRLAGISPSDLRRYKNPPEFESHNGALPNPDIDAPQMEFPPGRWEKLKRMTDAEVTATMSEPTPPVRLKR